MSLEHVVCSAHLEEDRLAFTSLGSLAFFAFFGLASLGGLGALRAHKPQAQTNAALAEEALGRRDGERDGQHRAYENR